jgi:hypothetical protein
MFAGLRSIIHASHPHGTRCFVTLSVITVIAIYRSSYFSFHKSFNSFFSLVHVDQSLTCEIISLSKTMVRSIYPFSAAATLM